MWEVMSFHKESLIYFATIYEYIKDSALTIVENKEVKHLQFLFIYVDYCIGVFIPI